MRRKYSALLLFLGLTLVAVAMACTPSSSPTATPVPTATPTPSPTPTPIPVAPLINADVANQAALFISSLPREEVQCAIDAIGESRFNKTIESGIGNSDLTAEELEKVSRCISSETVQRIVVSQLAYMAGGLSDATVRCAYASTARITADLAFSSSPDPTELFALMQALFCLDSSERRALEASESAYGFSEFGGIDSVECVVDEIPPAQLADILGSGSGTFSDFSVIGDLFPIFVKCGAISDETLAETGLTVAQLECLVDKIDLEALFGIAATGQEPAMEDLLGVLSAAGDCGVDLTELMGGTGVPDTGGLIPTLTPVTPTPIASGGAVTPADELPLTEAQMNCLINEIGEEQIAGILDGSVTPDLSLLGALGACGISISDLLQ